jgi:hypothetical protein
LTNLASVDLSSNALTMLPSGCFSGLPLVHLSLSNNKLSELPPSVCHLQQLAELFAEKNVLFRLPEGMVGPAGSRVPSSPEPY